MEEYRNESYNNLISNKLLVNDLSSIELPEKLMHQLNEEIVVVDGCSYFKNIAPEGPYSKELHDRSGNEGFHNRIHIDNYIESENPDDYFKYGIVYSNKLAEKLEDMGNKSFGVILSYNGEYCNVTFVENREEEDYLGVDELDEFKHESVLIIVTN